MSPIFLYLLQNRLSLVVSPFSRKYNTNLVILLMGNIHCVDTSAFLKTITIFYVCKELLCKKIILCIDTNTYYQPSLTQSSDVFLVLEEVFTTRHELLCWSRPAVVGWQWWCVQSDTNPKPPPTTRHPLPIIQILDIYQYRQQYPWHVRIVTKLPRLML